MSVRTVGVEEEFLLLHAAGPGLARLGEDLTGLRGRLVRAAAAHEVRVLSCGMHVHVSVGDPVRGSGVVTGTGTGTYGADRECCGG